MKIHILHDFKDQPWGGGNQFLKALKSEFEKQKVYEEESDKANVILFNVDISRFGKCVYNAGYNQIFYVKGYKLAY